MTTHVKVFDTYYEQLESLKTINESDYPLLLINKENNKINFSSDGIKDRNFKYDSEKYLNVDTNYYNSKYSVVPNDIDNIVVYDSNDQEVKTKKLNGLIIPKVYKEPLYKVGLISDVHYNDTDTSDQNPDTIGNVDGAEYTEDLINVMELFKENNVDFVSCAGDITTDSHSHLDNYRYCIEKYGQGIPVFTCSGNHDTKVKYRYYHENWMQTSVIDPNNEYDVVYFNDDEEWSYLDPNTNEYDLHHTTGQGTSFYIKKHYKDTFDVYIYLNVEYGWNSIDNYDTHNCRLLTQEELLVHSEVDEENDLHLYHPKTLQCLAEILEEFKDHRCFIFTHLMFPDKAGNFHASEMTDTNYYSYAEYYNHEDVLRGDQGEYIRNLMESYDNNYWFCGHSHYKWEWEKVDHNINITQTGNSYNIHLPSLSRPLEIKTYYSNRPKDSEAAIMEVYDDSVVIKGIVCKEGNAKISQQSRTEFPDNKMEYVTSDMFMFPDRNDSSIEPLEDNYILIHMNYMNTGNNDDNNIYLHPSIINTSNYGNYNVVLRFDDITAWTDEIMQEENEVYRNQRISNFTNNMLNSDTIGFRDNSTDSNQWKYYFKSNHLYTLYPAGLILKCSSSSIYSSYETIHIKVKMRIGLIHEGYQNKYLPIAIFKLPTIINEGEA